MGENPRILVFVSVIALMLAAVPALGADTNLEPVHDERLELASRSAPSPGSGHLAELLTEHRDHLLAQGDVQGASALALQLSQVELAEALRLAGDELPDDASLGLTIAQLAVDHRASLQDHGVSAAQLESLAQQARNLDFVDQARELTAQASPHPASTTELVSAITTHQARALGLDGLASLVAPGDRSLAEQMDAWLGGHELALTSEQRASLGALEAEHPAVASALGDVVHAFHALEEATEALQATSQAERVLQADVLSARLALAQAAVELSTAQQNAGPALTGPSDLSIPGVVEIHLDPSQDHAYTEDVVLLIDGGGDEVYHNNAGGNGFDTLGDPCATPSVHAAAALLDLGTGDDVYGDATAPRGCGANGGANSGGAGFLYDEGGNDAYTATGLGSNGGANIGFGALIDLGGQDVYDGGDFSANGAARRGVALLLDQGFEDDLYLTGRGPSNGGADEAGVALLLDEGGNETYNGTSVAVNGGAGSGYGGLVDLGTGDDAYNAEDNGVNGGGITTVGTALDDTSAGFLYDEGGDDSYIADDDGSNGAGRFGGIGMLIDDGEGADRYEGGEDGVNGGAHTAGIGFLIEGGGDDIYNGTDAGVNGGGDTQGIAFLYDGSGNDTYTGTREGINGGSEAGVAFLYEGGGDDVYTAEEEGTNGGANRGVALLYEVSGDDRYNGTNEGANGGVFLAGVGVLYDEAGNDVYTANNFGANGGTNRGGYGLLYDAAGTDHYEAAYCGVNGGGAELRCDQIAGVEFGHGLGTLYDGGGEGDVYQDGLTDCIDCTILPKGIAGAQVDEA